MQSGFTIIEVMAVLLISLMLAALGQATYKALIDKAHESAALIQLKDLITRAQQEAELRRVPLALCKAKQGQCALTGEDLLLFINEEQDGVLHAKKNSIALVHNNFIRDLNWRTYPRYRHYLLFFPSRLNSNDNGTLWRCKNDSPIWGLVLSSAGNLKTIWPNQNGVLIDPKGKRLECPSIQFNG